MILSLFVAGALYFARLLRYGSAIFVAGAGDHEVARCDGGDISWQAQYFARVRRVDMESFTDREVASCGGGERRSDIGIGARAGVVWRGWNRETALQGCLMCVLRWGFPPT